MKFKKRNSTKKKHLGRDYENGFKIVYSKNEKKNVENKPEKNNFIMKKKNVIVCEKKLVPWIKEKSRESNGMLKLHHEILEFFQFIKPKEDEAKKRYETINLIKKLIHDKWPHWRIKIFGSFPSDLHLPNSDIDVAIFKQESVNLKTFYNYANDSMLTDTSQLQLIYRELLMKNFISEIRYVDAKVPIIKAKCKQTGVNFDIWKNGYEAMKIIKNIIIDLPFIKPIIILLKFFLRQRDLNETFTGGVSSYLVFNMVYAYIQYLQRDKDESEEKIKDMNLGSFLMGLLKFYGYEFNYYDLGISIRKGGRFFKKHETNFPSNENLCFENFQEATIDIGRGAYQFPRVRELFQDVLCKFYKNKSNSESYLQHMIIITSELRKMQTMEREILPLSVKESNFPDNINENTDEE